MSSMEQRYKRWLSNWALVLLVFAQPVAGQDDQAPEASDIGGGVTLGGGGGETVGGYIDSAIVGNRLRFRFDAAYDNPFPDRAEFFYAKCGCFSNGNGPGPPLPESSVDYQELETYVEIASSCGYSAFVEVPIRSINPDVNANSTGLSDIRAGFKYALIDDCHRWLTFQLRGYFPTGDGDRGLGTEHIAIEPGLLFQSQYSRLTLMGELKAWIPVGSENEVFTDGTVREFSGTVMRYGLGAGYDVNESCYSCGLIRTTLVTELVGWTVLDGLKFRTSTPATPANPAGFVFNSAVNDTIVNVKIGLRASTPHNSIYVGYGRALTGEVWYEDVLRAEYEIRF